MKKQIIQSVLLEALLLLGLKTPAAGQSSARGVVIPADYDTFQPPSVHNSYVDPVFGSKVTRISNALATPNAAGSGYLTWISDEYSTMSPFNSDNSRILLVHQSYFGLYDGTGFYIRDLPLEINASSEPRWSRRDNQTIYYVHNNQLKTYDISSGVTIIVHTFSEYSAISGMGQSDISFDGDHFVFAGDSRYVFVYQISTGTKSPAFDTGVTAFDSICITPRNNVIISWLQSGTGRNTGQELFDGNMNFLRQVGHADGHSDVTLDTNGDEVLVWTNAADPQPICNAGIVKIRLADGTQTCLATLDFSLAVHISAPDSAGFVYVETYAPSNPSPSTSGWVEYTNELLQIKLDGSQVLRLAHHRSRPYQANTYNWQPKMSTSRDGSRVVYTSDYDLQIIDGYATQYGDTYLILVGGPSASAVNPGGGSGLTQSFTFTFTDPAGWQDLGVLDVLINNYLYGIGACYFALTPASAASGYLYLVDDAGDGAYVSGTPMLLPSGGSLHNSQCTLNGSGSSVSASGNTLTLMLSITFAPGFAGNKVIYTAARSNTQNSGWQALGTWKVPGPDPVGPGVGGMAPSRSSTAGQTYTFTFTDSNGYGDLAVLDVLTNSFLDANSACYFAYVPATATSGYLYLVDDAVDGGYVSGSPMALPSGGTLQNSQCTIYVAGSTASASGNTLTLNLSLAFKPAFAGNQVFYLAARNHGTGNSGWQAAGSVTVP